MPTFTTSPELEAIIGAIIYSDCRIDAIVSILNQKGVTVSSEEVENLTQNVYQKEFDTKRRRIHYAMGSSRSI